MPIFSKAFYTEQRLRAVDARRRRSARAPTRSAAQRRALHRVRARRRLLGPRTCRSIVGFNNFDVIRVDFFRERQTAFEAFKKGEITFREEFTSRIWATGLQFPGDHRRAGDQDVAVPGRERPQSCQGWFFNTRRGKFSDPRTRQAIGLAFDFEWIEPEPVLRFLRRGCILLREVATSRPTGMPTPEELALLEPFRAELPPEVFGEPYVPPQSDGSGRDRKLLRQASRAAAGGRLDADRQRGRRRGRRAARRSSS